MAKKHLHVAVVGWYHKLNYGDDLLQRALTRLFADCSLSFIGIEAASPLLLNGFDHVIFGGGSIYPNKLLGSRAALDALDVPLSLLGISSRGVKDRGVLHALLDRCAAVVVRDRATADEFAHARVRVAPDLAWLIPLPAAPGDTAWRGIGLNLRKWPKCDWSPTDVVAAVQRAIPEHAPTGLAFFDGDSSWESGQAQRDADLMRDAGLADLRADIERVDIGGFELVVAMRFHALVLAAQTATPVIGFDYHPKTRHFFDERGLGELCVPLDQPSRLQAAIADVRARDAPLRARLREQRDRCVDAAQQVYAAARDDILSATRSRRVRRGLLRGWLR